METKLLSPKPNSNSNKGLRSHFDRAVDLIPHREQVREEILRRLREEYGS
jgi:hypothetical protein